MKSLNILISLAIAAAPLSALADEYSVDFSQNIPRSLSCSNIDGGNLSPIIYHRIVPQQASWFWGRVASNNAAALCPTNNEDGSPRISRLTLPFINLDDDEESVLCWDARSFMLQVPEAYRVFLRTADTDWKEILYVAEETYIWSTRYISLADYAGKSVQLAFESATERDDAFMFAIDNIYVGVPQGLRYRYTPEATHYAKNGETTVIKGHLANYGITLGWEEIILVNADDETEVLASHKLDTMDLGDTADVELALVVPDDSTIKYKIYGRYNDGFTMLLDQDFVTSSKFRRTQFIDRYTGTWCNNCTKEELQVNRYNQRYGNQMIIVEAHVRDIDAMTCEEYWNGLGSECIFSVPQMMINHDRSTVNSSKNFQAAFDNELFNPVTICEISSKANLLDNRSTVRINTQMQFADNLDNSDDIYRVAYMLTADIHDPNNANYAQYNNAVGNDWEEYGYMPNIIIPKMRHFKNVVIEASTAIHGVPASLPAKINAGETMAHSFDLEIPEEYATMPIQAIAFLIDTRNGQILNCNFADGGVIDSVDDISADFGNVDNNTYDIYGRKISHTNLAPGIYVRAGHKVIIKK